MCLVKVLVNVSNKCMLTTSKYEFNCRKKVVNMCLVKVLVNVSNKCMLTTSKYGGQIY